MALTELPDFFAAIVAPALPPDWASGAEDYFSAQHNHRKIPGFSEGGSPV